MDHDDPALEPPGPERNTGTTVLVAVVGIAIGLAIAAGVLWLTDRDDGGSPAGSTIAADPPTTDELDPVDLVVAYGRSRTEDHALDGELRRPGRDPLPVRRAIRGDRELDEVGDTAAVTEDGVTRQCELIDGDWLCAAPLPRIETEIDVQGFATLLLTAEPPYTVFDVTSEPPAVLSVITELGPSTCWSMVSADRRDRARFGAETTLCFHDELGALVGRSTETSTGDDVFVATDLRAEVEVADVEPSR